MALYVDILYEISQKSAQRNSEINLSRIRINLNFI